MNTILIMGIVAVSFMILYFIINFHSNDALVNMFIQCIGIGFVFVMLIILSKGVLDEKNYCSLVVDNSTTSGSTTHFDYTYFCYENPNNTAVTFYTTVLWLIRIIAGFMVVYVVYTIAKFMIGRIKMLQGRG